MMSSIVLIISVITATLSTVLTALSFRDYKRLTDERKKLLDYLTSGMDLPDRDRNNKMKWYIRRTVGRSTIKSVVGSLEQSNVDNILKAVTAVQKFNKAISEVDLKKGYQNLQ